jgi:hypothetical protein
MHLLNIVRWVWEAIFGPLVLSQTHDSLRRVCEVLDRHAVPLPAETVDRVGALSTRGPRTSRS